LTILIRNFFTKISCLTLKGLKTSKKTWGSCGNRKECKNGGGEKKGPIQQIRPQNIGLRGPVKTSRWESRKGRRSNGEQKGGKKKDSGCSKGPWGRHDKTLTRGGKRTRRPKRDEKKMASQKDGCEKRKKSRQKRPWNCRPDGVVPSWKKKDLTPTQGPAALSFTEKRPKRQYPDENQH